MPLFVLVMIIMMMMTDLFLCWTAPSGIRRGVDKGGDDGPNMNDLGRYRQDAGRARPERVVKRKAITNACRCLVAESKRHKAHATVAL